MYFETQMLILIQLLNIEFQLSALYFVSLWYYLIFCFRCTANSAITNTGLQNKSGAGLNKCYVFWPANGCFAPCSLIEFSILHFSCFFLFFPHFDVKRVKTRQKRRFFLNIKECLFQTAGWQLNTHLEHLDANI